MPEEEQWETERIHLNEETAGAVQTVEMTNERKTGFIILTKTDDTGANVGNAVYALYRAEEDGTFSMLGTYTTGNDRETDAYGEIHVDGLPWGTYYFKETQAPAGYELNPERIEFRVDRVSVQNIIYVKTMDNRSTGSVRLTKRDKQDLARKLSGATYELFTTDGKKCMNGTDYTLPDGMASITTGVDGSILITGIRQGAYYLKELTAPESYTVSDELIRFSVTKSNAGSIQELTAEDEMGKALIRIHKTINTAYEPFGDPTFLFMVTRDDGKTWQKSVTLTEGNHSDSIVFTVDAGHTYRIREIETSRYRLVRATAQKNVSIVGTEGHADLTAGSEAEMTFENEMLQYEKYSHMAHALNLVTSKAVLTGIKAVYRGPNPISDTTPGYDVASESYRIRKNDLAVTAFYDDGTERILKEKEYELNPETADGLSDSYTGTVTFCEDGIVRTDTFQVKIQPAQASERITVTYNLSGGSIIPDGESSLQETYVLRIKKGSVLTKPVNVPTREGYQFLGWVDRDGIGTEAEAAEHAFDFSKVQDASVTIHAAWEQNAVQVKYAVSIYGIQEDTVKGGDLAGLTFGPATGENYNHTHKKHVPISGYPCIHDMSWEETVSYTHLTLPTNLSV